jgi:hypothetical protein
MNAFLMVVVATGLQKAIATTTTSPRQWPKAISVRRSKLGFFLKDVTVNFADQLQQHQQQQLLWLLLLVPIQLSILSALIDDVAAPV